jgi:hypothetical protein
MDKHNIKPKINYRKLLEYKHIKWRKETNKDERKQELHSTEH